MKTPISQLGKVAFVDRLTAENPYTGDDAAVIHRGDFLELVTSATMFEGVDFDLEYFPLRHLGHKAVTYGVSNIYAMNGTPKYITVSLGLSTRFSVEDVEAIYEGIRMACNDYGIELIGGNTSASLTGLMIAVTTVGEVSDDAVTRRSGAAVSDLLCITGSLGAAYMGVKLLEREKRALAGNSGVKPKLEGHEYLLGKQLHPFAAKSVVDAMREAEVVPTAMIDITRGLASAALNLCHRSNVGVRVMLDRIPISKEVFALAEEFGIDPVVAALNGGDDFELLFTVPVAMHKDVLAFAEVIGYVVPEDEGAHLVTPDNNLVRLLSPDFTTSDPLVEVE